MRRAAWRALRGCPRSRARSFPRAQAAGSERRVAREAAAAIQDRRRNDGGEQVMRTLCGSGFFIRYSAIAPTFAAISRYALMPRSGPMGIWPAHNLVLSWTR